jgi:hypothetical protein
MGNKLELFQVEAESLLAVLTEYNEVTDRLCEIDLQQYSQEEDLALAISDIEVLIDEREEIRERVDFARNSMIAVMGDSAETRGLDIVSKLLSLQSEIVEKDKLIISRYAHKHGEVKGELKNLQGEKKKIDFLNSTAGVSQEATEFNV